MTAETITLEGMVELEQRLEIAATAVRQLRETAQRGHISTDYAAKAIKLILDSIAAQ